MEDKTTTIKLPHTVDLYVGIAKKHDRKIIALPKNYTYGVYYLHRLHSMTFDRFPIVSDVLGKTLTAVSR